jgi:Fe-Mn family superoxide dismutase
MFAVIVLLACIAAGVQSQTVLTLPPLPYAYNALQPVLSEQLMRLHHDKHFATYTNKSNMALKAMYTDTHNGDKLKEMAEKPIEVILSQLTTLPEQYHLALRHNGGGYVNHKLFFSMLKAPTATAAENMPSGPVLEAIEKSFTSFEKFKEMFSAASVNLFGSGWVWLYIDARTKQLVLNFTANQDNPIMFDKNHAVILGIDLWEHAYYPVYENRRVEYINNFWRIINWPVVAQLYTEGQTKRVEL